MKWADSGDDWRDGLEDSRNRFVGYEIRKKHLNEYPVNTLSERPWWLDGLSAYPADLRRLLFRANQTTAEASAATSGNNSATEDRRSNHYHGGRDWDYHDRSRHELLN